MKNLSGNSDIKISLISTNGHRKNQFHKSIADKHEKKCKFSKKLQKKKQIFSKNHVKNLTFLKDYMKNMYFPKEMCKKLNLKSTCRNLHSV